MSAQNLGPVSVGTTTAPATGPAPGPATATAPGPPAPPSGARLAWLDALRGIAALCVVYAHFGARVLPALHSTVYRTFDPGLYGVLVFFLISGYIVPASLERRGSVRTFWISRVFRLFPLFALVIAIALLLHVFGLASLRGANRDPATAVLAHLFMLSDLMGQPSLVVVAWTLSYEMVFYLLVTALFTAGLHRRSGRLAAAFAIGALLLGGALPTVWLSYHSPGLTTVALAGDALVIGGLALAVATHGLPRVLGAWLAAATGLVLVAFNERRFAYEGLTILALMFAGTLLYRAQQGQVNRRHATVVITGVFGAVIAAGLWHIPALTAAGHSAQVQRQWVVSVALAGLTFAAGLALQNLRVPAVLAWLGLVSYSVYLMLPLLLDAYDGSPLARSYQDVDWLQVAVSAVFVAALLGCAALTYYLVEAPMQRVGRRVAARLDARYRSRHPSVAESRSRPNASRTLPSISRVSRSGRLVKPISR